MTLTESFGFNSKDTVSIVGSGGKTTLGLKLIMGFPCAKTLFTTTTKILPPGNLPGVFFGAGINDVGRLVRERGSGSYILVPGLTPDGRKCDGYAPQELAGILPFFDYAFIESDGSKEKPLKGWAEHEPVVVPETTVTVGVLSLRAEGLAVNEENVHRLPLFLALIGDPGAAFVRPEHLRDAVLHPRGLFKSAAGKRVLFLNQADDAELIKRGAGLARMIRESGGAGLSKIIVGSAKKNRAAVV